MFTFEEARRVLYTFFKELNFYTADSMDDHEIRNGRISTRLYIVLLISSLAILTTYTLASYETRTIIIANPSLLVYEKIRAKFGSDQVACPCNEMFIDYGLFSSVEPIFHPICSSIFIEKTWFDFLESFNTIALESAFAYNAFYQFQMIAELCQSAQNAINDTLSQYVTTKWIATEVETENITKAAIEQIIRARISTTVNTFRRSFNLVRIPHNYQATLVSIGTPPPFVKYYNVKDLRFSEGDVDQMTPCSCDREPYCKAELAILPESNDYGNSTGIFLIPHLFTGCDFVNTLMASTLDCFFNQSCLDTVQNTRIWTTKYIALRPSLPFPPNTTIQIIVDQMFIETWDTTFNYSAYYETCHPVACSYTVTVNKDVGVLIATIISIFGGLNACLNLLVPRVVRFARGKGKELYKKLRLRLARHRAVSSSTP